MDRTSFMRRAIALSLSSLDRPGTRPFAAVVVRDGKIIGEGLNSVDATMDPTSHGEIGAIRAACRELGSPDLNGCELYSTCEPCPMCTAAIYRSGVSRLYFAVSLLQSSELAERFTKATAHLTASSQQDQLLVQELATPPTERSLPASTMLQDEASAALEAWWRHQCSD